MSFKPCSWSLSCLQPGWRKTSNPQSNNRTTQTEMTEQTETDPHESTPRSTREVKNGQHQWPLTYVTEIKSVATKKGAACTKAAGQLPRPALWQQESGCTAISHGLCPSHPEIPIGRQTAATRHTKWGNNRKWSAALPNIFWGCCKWIPEAKEYASITGDSWGVLNNWPKAATSKEISEYIARIQQLAPLILRVMQKWSIPYYQCTCLYE